MSVIHSFDSVSVSFCLSLLLLLPLSFLPPPTPPCQPAYHSKAFVQIRCIHPRHYCSPAHSYLLYTVLLRSCDLIRFHACKIFVSLEPSSRQTVSMGTEMTGDWGKGARNRTLHFRHQNRMKSDISHYAVVFKGPQAKSENVGGKIHLFGFVWRSYQYLCNKSAPLFFCFFFFSSSILSFSGCNHIGSLFINEEQKNVGSWRNRPLNRSVYSK